MFFVGFSLWGFDGSLSLLLTLAKTSQSFSQSRCASAATLLSSAKRFFFVAEVTRSCWELLLSTCFWLCAFVCLFNQQSLKWLVSAKQLWCETLESRVRNLWFLCSISQVDAEARWKQKIKLLKKKFNTRFGCIVTSFKKKKLSPCIIMFETGCLPCQTLSVHLSTKCYCTHPLFCFRGRTQ